MGLRPLSPLLAEGLRPRSSHAQVAERPLLTRVSFQEWTCQALPGLQQVRCRLRSPLPLAEHLHWQQELLVVGEGTGDLDVVSVGWAQWVRDVVPWAGEWGLCPIIQHSHTHSPSGLHVWC